MKECTKWPVRLAWLFVVLCFLWSGYVTWNATEKLLDGDASSEMVLSSILAEDGGILTTRWHYSTELRVLHTQLVFAPLFHVFHDWHTIRFAGTMMMQVLLLLSYGFYCQSLGGRRGPCLIGAGLMLLPRSIVYGRIVLYQTGYLPHLTFNFLLFGLFIHLIRRERGNRIRFSLFLLLSFGVGLNGVRHGMITFVPLLLTVLIRTLRQIDRFGIGVIQEKHVIQETAISILGSATWLTGYLINHQVLSQKYVFKDMADAEIVFPQANEFFTVFRAYLNSFGFDRYPLVSIRGILAMLAFCAALAMLFFSLRSFQDAEKDADESLAILISACVHTVSILSILLLNRTRLCELYLTPAFAFMIPTAAVSKSWLGTTGRKQSQRLIAVASAFVVLTVGFYHSLFFRNPFSRDLRYSGVAFENKNNVKELDDVAQFLKEQDYTLGYAPFWQAAVIREMTDGQVATLAMWNTGLHYYEGWLNEWQRNNPDSLEREKHFLVTTKDFSEKLEKVAVRQFEGTVYDVWTFESGEALWEFVN